MASWIHGNWQIDKASLDTTNVETDMTDEKLIEEIRETFAESAKDLSKWGRQCDEKWPNLCQYAYFERGLYVEPSYHQQTEEKKVEVKQLPSP